MSSARAAVVLFRLGRDPALGVVRCVAARVLSAYQRAPVHFLAEAGWAELDWMLSSLLRWGLLRSCKARARFWREQPAVDLSSSGWIGSLFVIGVWIALAVAVLRAFPVRADALIQ